MFHLLDIAAVFVLAWKLESADFVARVSGAESCDWTKLPVTFRLQQPGAGCWFLIDAVLERIQLISSLARRCKRNGETRRMSSFILNHRRHEIPRESEQCTTKARKHWAWKKAVPYLLKEQRLLFILLGIALTSAFFLLQPQYRFRSSSRGKSEHLPLSERHDISYHKELSSSDSFGGYENAYDSWSAFGKQQQQQHIGHMSTGAKIPLGLKRKALRVVVTGGAGFVGSHLVDKLIARGDSVIVVDNFFTGRKENVMHHLGNPRFELIRHDVVEPLLLEVDQIYHLACPASPVHYKFNPVKTIISSSFHACVLTVSIWTSRIKKAKEKASLFCRRCWSALNMLG